MMNFVNFRKDILVALVLFLLGSFCSAQEFLVKLPYNSTHFIIDDNVNVRSEPSLDGQKQFKLNTGDKVVILSKSLADFDYSNDRVVFEELKAKAGNEPYLLADGLFSPWYKIKCNKGEGYVCGRYVSCKELLLDVDGDGKMEVLASLTTAQKKGMLAFDDKFYDDNHFHEYWEAGGNNKDTHHILIKDKKAFPLDFAKGFYSSYEVLNTKSIFPYVCVIKLESAVRTYGGGSSHENYFYYAGGKFSPLFSIDSDNWDGDTGGSGFEVSTDKNSIVVDFYRWILWQSEKEREAGEYSNGENRSSHYQETERTKTRYTWNGKSFSKEEKEIEINFPQEYLDYLDYLDTCK